jgi:hypothetical protein
LHRQHIDRAVAENAEDGDGKHHRAVFADPVGQIAEQDADDDIDGGGRKNERRIEAIAQAELADTDDGLIGRGGRAGKAECEDRKHAHPDRRVAEHIG